MFIIKYEKYVLFYINIFQNNTSNNLFTQECFVLLYFHHFRDICHVKFYKTKWSKLLNNEILLELYMAMQNNAIFQIIFLE